MRKIIYFTFFIFLLNTSSLVAQKTYTSLANLQYVETLTEKAYWNEYVDVEEQKKLYKNLKGPILFTDYEIKVYIKTNNSGPITYRFYQGGKLIGEKVGSRMANYLKFKVKRKTKKEKG
jgi:hypothetical protein